MNQLLHLGKDSFIETDYGLTETFDLKSPELISKTGMVLDGRSVFTLTYLVKEIKRNGAE